MLKQLSMQNNSQMVLITYQEISKESDDGILEQVHEHIAEFLNAVQAGKIRIAEFSSAKCLVEELMQDHAKQPAQRFTGKGARKYRCLFCTNIYETTAN